MKTTLASLLLAAGLTSVALGTRAWAQANYVCTYNCGYACGKGTCYPFSGICDGAQVVAVYYDPRQFGACTSGSGNCTAGRQVCHNFILPQTTPPCQAGCEWDMPLSGSWCVCGQ